MILTSSDGWQSVLASRSPVSQALPRKCHHCLVLAECETHHAVGLIAVFRQVERGHRDGRHADLLREPLAQPNVRAGVQRLV